MVNNYTPRQTPVVQALLWDGKPKTLDLMPGFWEAYAKDHEIVEDGTLNCFFDGFFWHQSWQKDRDYIVKGSRGTFFAVPAEHFANLYRPVNVNLHGKVYREIEIFPFPKIPDGVNDIEVKSEAQGKIWTMQSGGDGIDQWAQERRGPTWGMPEKMIEDAKPHYIEYWRALCPFWTEDVVIDVIRKEDQLGGRTYYWLVTDK